MRQYKSASQQVRVMTESWLGQNAYCPNCGRQPITQFENNRPVADFYCQDCAEQFELKSKSGQSAGRSVADGAYQTMIERIQSEQNPNFFCLSYRKVDYAVRQLVLIPKHFVTPAMIVPRKQGIPNHPQLHHVFDEYRQPAGKWKNSADKPRAGHATRNRVQTMAAIPVLKAAKNGEKRLVAGHNEMR